MSAGRTQDSPRNIPLQKQICHCHWHNSGDVGRQLLSRKSRNAIIVGGDFKACIKYILIINSISFPKIELLTSVNSWTWTDSPLSREWIWCELLVERAHKFPWKVLYKGCPILRKHSRRIWSSKERWNKNSCNSAVAVEPSEWEWEWEWESEWDSVASSECGAGRNIATEVLAHKKNRKIMTTA